MKKQNKIQGEHLEQLFVLELQFQWEMAPVTSRSAGEGEYIGSGTGKASGVRVTGNVSWDLFEIEEEKQCRSNLMGLIKTGDGAEIKFDSRGFFIKPDEANPNRWIATASVRFDTADQRYGWLNTQLAVWEGEFDMAIFQHSYMVYFPVVD